MSQKPVNSRAHLNKKSERKWTNELKSTPHSSIYEIVTTRVLLKSRDPELQEALTTLPGVEVILDPRRNGPRELFLRRKGDLGVLDLDLHPEPDQLEFLEELRDLGVPVVVLAEDNPRRKGELARRGVESFRLAPIVAQPLNRLECPTRLGEGETTAQRAASVCKELVGSGPESRAVYEMIRRVATLDVFVLITGENGTGKELIARAIHSLGNRKSRQFVAVSCGAIPEALIEAELFGSEKGAFTGAAARRVGYLEEARDGTLLLDEIAELSLHTQTRLLRVLQEREFMRLGSSVPVPLRARMLFATNRNLRQMVDQGAFREDLYYRLNVVGIHSSPLRERREDIPELAQHFLDKYSRMYRKHINGIHPDAQALLSSYDWPGNVRELENAIQRAIVLSDNDRIDPCSLPETVRQSRPDLAPEAIAGTSFEDQLREFKVKLAIDAVKDCNGNKTLAAQSLNISRTYLHRLIREPEEENSAVAAA
jgi:DNA-binding NtrC family response regulator